jgi:diaminopimelate epimerase
MAPFEKMGVNLNFVQKIGDAIWIRTCECGLEMEPLSCGTGAVASALAASICYGLRSPIEVHTKGGCLWVTFQLVQGRSFTDIHLVGSVVQTFSGKIDLNALRTHGHKSQQNIDKNLSIPF